MIQTRFRVRTIANIGTGRDISAEWFDSWTLAKAAYKRACAAVKAGWVSGVSTASIYDHANSKFLIVFKVDA